jgi:hypothetical protein
VQVRKMWTGIGVRAVYLSRAWREMLERSG